MLIIMPALGHINIPADPDKRASLLGLQDKPYVAKQLINFMLDVCHMGEIYAIQLHYSFKYLLSI